MITKQQRATVLANVCEYLAPGLLRFLRASSRIVPQGEEYLQNLLDTRPNFILAFWHGQMLPVLFYFRKGGFYTFISPHRDGEYIARALEGMGHHALRTSLKDRRLKALGQALKLARSGETLVVTPDGPRGPRFEAKTGIIKLSRKTGLPILPVAGVAGRARYLPSWDRFCLPYLLGTIHVRFGEPHRPVDGEDDEASATRLESNMRQLTRKAADGLYGLDDYLEDLSAA